VLWPGHPNIASHQHLSGEAVPALRTAGILPVENSKGKMPSPREQGQDALATADVLLLATGSEVSVALSAAEALAKENIAARVVSMPCWELFEKQSQQYKDSVIPPNLTARVAIEAGVELGWHKYIGDRGVFIGVSTFGTSAPAKVCFEKYGITVENVVKAVKKSMANPD
jgi:transketolase